MFGAGKRECLLIATKICPSALYLSVCLTSRSGNCSSARCFSLRYLGGQSKGSRRRRAGTRAPPLARLTTRAVRALLSARGQP